MQELESNRENQNEVFKKESNTQPEPSHGSNEVFSAFDFEKFMTLLKNNRQVNAMN